MRHDSTGDGAVSTKKFAPSGAQNRRADEVRESSSALRWGEMRAAFEQPKVLLQAGTHLLDVGPWIAVRGTRPGLAQATVPLFYRRDLKHKACQARYT